MELLDVGTKVRWLQANPDGWAGAGMGTIMAIDEKRPHFEGATRATRKSPSTGPAYLVRLDSEGSRKLDVWAAPDEVMVAL